MEFLGVFLQEQPPGKQFGEIPVVVFVIVVDMTQHIYHPVAEVHIGSLAAPQQ